MRGLIANGSEPGGTAGLARTWTSADSTCT